VSSADRASTDREPSDASHEITALIRGTDGAKREWRRGSNAISTDKRRLDVDAIHGYLARSYWAERIPRSVAELSIENSLCFGLYEIASAAATHREPSDARHEITARHTTSSAPLGAPRSEAHSAHEKQIGFARLVTDGATFAWLGDVFVLE
jgi:hypothetical protein